MAKVYIIGTCDTKEAELAYAKACVEKAGAEAVLVDVGTKGGSSAADVSNAAVAKHHPEGVKAVLGLDDRGKAVSAMATALTAFLAKKKDIGACSAWAARATPRS